MKAQSYSEKNMKNIVYPAISQRKCDGARCLAFNPLSEDEDIFFMTSSGKTYYNLNALAEELSRLPKGYVYDGELLVLDEEGKVMSRKAGNGVLNKAIHNTISEEEAKRVCIVLWDCIKIDDYNNDKGTESYKVVYNSLNNLLDDSFKRISLVESKMVNTREEAFAHFKEMLERGEEGTILKNLSSKWEDKRSKNCVKFKIVIQTTMKVTGFLEGNEKFADNLGAILCESSEGSVQVRVGSGLSDEDRMTIWKDKDAYLGKFIEVESNGLILADDGTYSLFLPRFVEVRFDKEEADTYEMIKALSDGSQMLM
jgi:DNA ligase-1